MATNWNKSEEKEPLLEPSESNRQSRRASLLPTNSDETSHSRPPPPFMEPTPENNQNSLIEASVIPQAPESLSSDASEEPCQSSTWPRRRIPPPSPRRRSLPARFAPQQYPESVLSSHSLELTGSSNVVDISDASAQSRSWEPIESGLDSEVRALLDIEEEKRNFKRAIYAMCVCAVLILIICGFVAGFTLSEYSDDSPSIAEELLTVTTSSVTEQEMDQ